MFARVPREHPVASVDEQPVVIRRLPHASDKTWVVHAPPSALFLDGTYEENQLWLGFIRYAHFKIADHAPSEDINEAHKASLRFIDEKFRKPYARVTNDDRQLFLYHGHEDQRCLPFNEKRQLSHRQFERLSMARYAGWDRDNRNQPLTIMVQYSQRESTIQWCFENARGFFYVARAGVSVTFERASDAMLFRLSVS